MRLHTRLLSLSLAAGLSAGAMVPALGADPSPHPVPRACQEALSYERLAANDTSSPQQAYDASIAGLEANKRCSDEPMRLTREAYLLSMRAAAEHALNVGNWRRDLTRAQMLLANCMNRPDLGRTDQNNCRTQSRYNEDWMKRTLAQPTPAPAGSAAPATPRPAGTYAPPAAGAPRPVIGPAQSPPPPSPRP